MNQRVAITGYGGLTSLGHDIESTWDGLRAGRSGIGPITHWDSSSWDYPLGAEIKDVNPRKLLPDKKLLKLIGRHDVFGINAATQAVAKSGLIEYREGLIDSIEFNDKTGIYVGSPGNKFHQQYDFMPLIKDSAQDFQRFSAGLFDVVHPMWLLRILPNNVLAHVGIHYGFKGANQNITNHVVGGMQAIIEAWHAINEGIIDRAVVIAYDAGIEPQSLIYYGGLGALSRTELKPFDINRQGTILGDAAAALVLERADLAEQRGAKIYAECVAGASTSEATGIFPIRRDGDGVFRAMQKTLNLAKLTADDVGMVSAHGNANVLSDSAEATAIKKLFSDSLPVTAYKWATGHTLCTSGVLETIFSLLALRDEVVPGIATLERQASDCEGINISNKEQKPRSPYAMIIARGFASLNASLLIKAV